MTYFLSKTKALSHLLEYACTYSLPSCAIFQRSFCTKHVLFTKNLQIHKINDEMRTQDTPKNFGKIVDLDVDFDNVEFASDNLPREKKKKNKKRSAVATGVVEEGVSQKKSEKESLSKSAILKKNTNLMRSVMIDLISKKKRNKFEEVILEGKRLITDAMKAGCTPVKIFYSRESDLKLMEIPENVPNYKVPYDSFKVWGDAVTSQGVLGVFKLPNLEDIQPENSELPLTVICDNIRDPGNLGAVLRIVASAGCQKLILTKGCTDIWEPKVLRAGAGAHFRLPIKRDSIWSDIETELDEETKIILADLNYNHDSSTPFQNISTECGDLPVHCYSSVQYNDENAVIILGGETHGLSNEAYNFASKRKGVRVFIPMSNGVESLNNAVTLGILVYDFKRQLDVLRNKLAGNESQSQIEN